MILFDLQKPLLTLLLGIPLIVLAVSMIRSSKVPKSLLVVEGIFTVTLLLIGVYSIWVVSQVDHPMMYESTTVLWFWGMFGELILVICGSIPHLIAYMSQ